ncbi:hypothetical protein BS78_10G278500 [Paspalum vaginatum]|nr:hypothetical protein BS78_10G278500 [Paspalum vaginatum]
METDQTKKPGGGYGRVAAEGQDPGGSSGGYGRAPVAGQAPGGTRGGHGDGRASVAGQAPCGSSADQESVHGSGQDRQESVGYYIKSAMATTSDYQEAVGGNGRAAVCYRYDRYNQYMDLYLRGRPTSSFWEPIWLSKPLVFHDKGMLLAHEYLLERNPEFEPSSTRYYEHDLVDLTDEVTDVLNNDPGPMKCFRMDSSYWNNSTLDYWVSVLSTKRIQKLTLVNLPHPCNLEFPIYDLQSSNLDSLSLAFMTIPDMDVNCFEYSNLTSLQLSACSFNGRMLSWIVSDCPRLQKHTIGLCIENLRLISKTLEKIILWQCKASWIIVSECPKLRHLIVGV